MNLLTDSLIRVQTTAGPTLMSVPELLSALGSDGVLTLPGVQRHQEDPVHMFFCYLAAAVLAREKQTETKQAVAFWLDGIRKLTGLNDDCGWTLAVPDFQKPAFLQAPVTSASLAAERFKPSRPIALTPDNLDILETAKNHDVKAERATSASPDLWIFALISLQTTAGYGGAGRYGIARMNSGIGSRICVSVVHGSTPGARWAEDVTRLLAIRDNLLRGPWKFKKRGHTLLWTEPWDLESPLSLENLDPFFIEICRAVRLVQRGTDHFALGTSTRTTRIAAQDLNGVLGDPWTPLADGGEKAWTVKPPVFSPTRIRNLLFEDAGLLAPAMMQPLPGTEDASVILRGSVIASGGAGRTEGFHSISLPIPAIAAKRLFRREQARDRMAELSQIALNDAAIMQQRVLKPAVFAYLEGGPDTLDFSKAEFTAWWDEIAARFTRGWESDFFPWLWRTVDEPDEATARQDWLQSLKDKARTRLDEALLRYPARAGRHYRARSSADRRWSASLFSCFPELKENVGGRS